MDNATLFECMRRIHEMHSTARAVDPGAMDGVQKSKGDSTYSLHVSVKFKFIAGNHWEPFCDIYDTRKDKKGLSDAQMEMCRRELQTFWNAIKRSGRFEFESVAEWYIRIKDAA